LGRLAEGYDQMMAGIAKWRALGDQRYTALGLNFICQTAVYLGYYKEAQAFMQESIELCTQVGDRWGLGTAYRNLGLVALAQGKFAEAQTFIEKSLDLFTEITTGWDFVLSFIYLGEAKQAAGETQDAMRIFLDALRLGIEVQSISLALEAVAGLASLQARAGKDEEALELSHYVLNHVSSAQQAKERAARLILEADAQLAPEQAQAARERSQDLSLEAILNTFLKD
jgi:tetratricopeptide (TPR) repeat protein